KNRHHALNFEWNIILLGRVAPTFEIMLEAMEVLGRRSQTENEVPQPQEEVEFGLSNRKDWPMRSSTKSSRDPCRKGSDTSSMATRAPSRSITRSSGLASCNTSNV